MKKLESLLILTYISSLCFLLKAVGIFNIKTDGDGIVGFKWTKTDFHI